MTGKSSIKVMKIEKFISHEEEYKPRDREWSEAVLNLTDYGK